jgi:hypothetical protein
MIRSHRTADSSFFSCRMTSCLTTKGRKRRRERERLRNEEEASKKERRKEVERSMRLTSECLRFLLDSARSDNQQSEERRQDQHDRGA